MFIVDNCKFIVSKCCDIMLHISSILIVHLGYVRLNWINMSTCGKIGIINLLEAFTKGMCLPVAQPPRPSFTHIFCCFRKHLLPTWQRQFFSHKFQCKSHLEIECLEGTVEEDEPNYGQRGSIDVDAMFIQWLDVVIVAT